MFDIKSVELRSEEQIVSSWNDKENTKVSVLCTSYNHAHFIEDSIIGFLMQETDFAFEVIIHDDASTDNTANIIKGYQNRYPRIIKAIYQSENQHSKGKFKSCVVVMPLVRGKFIALCEGDDYWIDSHKLQKQLDICERDKDISFVAHNSLTLSCQTGDFDTVEEWGSRPYCCDLNEILSAPKAYGQFSPTASYFISKDVYDHLPDWFYKTLTGDFYLETLSALRGKMIFIADVMSVYRIENDNAYTGVMKRSLERRIHFFYNKLESLNHFKKLVPAKEKKLVDRIIADIYVGLLYDMGKLKLTDAIKFFLLSSFYARKIKFSTVKILLVVSLPDGLLNKLRLLKSSYSK